MDDLTRLLLRRYAEIEHRLAALKTELGSLEDERIKVSTAAEAINIDLEELMVTEAQFLPTVLRRREVETEDKDIEVGGLTIKEAALKLLDGKPDGMTANEILAAMFKEYRMHYPRSSLSPQLSRLKADGEIELENGRWRRISKPSEPRLALPRI